MSLKLQDELNLAIERVRAMMDRFGESAVRQTAAEWKRQGKSDVFIACSIVKAAVGTNTICEWYDKYDCTDDHVTSLAIRTAKVLNLL